MSQASLNQLHIDLDAENYAKDGVVIDIRNNSGGFVNVYAIDVLARRGYLTMTLRGTSATPARTVLGQRALNRPTILVTNQHSLSDAEDFSRRLSHAAPGPGRRRTNRRLDHLHVEPVADRRHELSPAAHENHGERRHQHGAQPTPRRHRSHAPYRRNPNRPRLPTRRRRPRAPETTRRVPLNVTTVATKGHKST